MKKTLFCALVLGSSLFAEDETPVFAGTLLTYISENAEPGHLIYQPVLFVTGFYGVYNKHWKEKDRKTIGQVDLNTTLETGITKNFDISVIFDGFYNRYRGRGTVLYGDTEVDLGWQISRDKKDSWVPDARLLVGEIFPTGKFQHLDPEKGGSDISGAGSYVTVVVGVIQKIFYVWPNHPCNFNLNLIYFWPTKVKVSGLNVYGNGEGTASPGNHFIADLGLEYKFDKYWGAGTDFRYEHQGKSSFKRGGLPSSEIFSLAPSLEYNFSENLTLAWGAWFSVAGRNSLAFASGVVNLYCNF